MISSRSSSSPRPSQRKGLVPSVILSAVLALGAASVHAENLAEVYEAARGYDAAYLAAKAQAESAVHKAAQAKALFRPTVGLNAGATRTETDPPNSGAVSINNTQVGVQATQPLLNRANGASVDQSEKALEIAQADALSAEQDLIVRSAQAYFDVLAAQDSLNTARAAKKAISEQLASAKRNFEVGTATITDTREAQARFDLATAQELAADNDLRTKRVALDQLVGRQDVQPKPLVQPFSLAPEQPAVVDEWVSKTTDAPQVRKARLAYDIAKLETRKASAGHWPTLNAVGNLGTAHNSGDGVVLASQRGTANSASLGLQLALPLYAGNAITNREKEAASLETKARNDLDAANRAVSQGTRQAFFGVQSGQAQVKALEAAEASTKLALEATQLGYKVGVRVNLDVLNAQTQLFTTQRDLAKARYDLLLNSLKLRQVAGILAPADVQRVNDAIAR